MKTKINKLNKTHHNLLKLLVLQHYQYLKIKKTHILKHTLQMTYYIILATVSVMNIYEWKN